MPEARVHVPGQAGWRPQGYREGGGGQGKGPWGTCPGSGGLLLPENKPCPAFSGAGSECFFGAV